MNRSQSETKAPSCKPKSNPRFDLVDDAKRFTLNATKSCIQLDAKMMDIFWLFTASLLIGVYRQKSLVLDFFEPNAKCLTRKLIMGLGYSK
jgi:hypothetical protein